MEEIQGSGNNLQVTSIFDLQYMARKCESFDSRIK